MEKSTGDKFSPCLTPHILPKKGDNSLYTDTHDFMFEYKFYMTRKNLPLMLVPKSLLRSPTRQTESNALEKSTNEQNKFFLLNFKYLIRQCKTKM